MSELTIAAIKKLKVAELKAELSKRGLAVKGKKDELAKRLTEALQEQDGDAAQTENGMEEQQSMDATISSSGETEDQSSQEESSAENTAPEDSEIADPSQTDQQAEVDDASTENKDSSDTAEKPKDAADDWVMVEPPTAEEESAASDAAVVQDTASAEQVETSDAVESEQVTTEVSVKEPADTGDVEMSEAAAADTSEVKTEETKTETEKATEGGEKTEEVEKKEAPKEEPKIVDTLVEVEAEEGEDTEFIEIPEGHVALDGYSSDINFIITEGGLTGHNLVKNGFSYLWAGARANQGGKAGKIGYEIKIIKSLEVDLPEKEAPIHGVRVGWSVENSNLQLGESALSYGYESTGKVCASSSFFAYGETFGEGDVIGTYLDLSEKEDTEEKTLRYTKNGEDLGVAMSLKLNLDEKPLFPHVLIRNMKVELNFGGREEPWFETLEGFSLIQNAGAENVTDKTYSRPENKESCEVLLLVGLPNSGKSTWVNKYLESHMEKCFNVIGVNQVLERCRLEGKRRKKSDSGHDQLMKSVIKVLSKLYELAPKKNRNYIFDQNNVYETAQNTKMEAFAGFKRKAVVVVPTHDNLRRRTSDAKRKGDNIHDVPFADLCDMKCEFHLPTVGELFDEVIFPELDEKNATKTIHDYQSDGSRAKKTGRDEYYPKKRPRNDDRSYGRKDRYSGGRDRREDGWKSSGSGYGRDKDRSSYGSGGSYGGNRTNYGQYQDPYRKNSGGGGGYRQQSSYGGGGAGYRGGSYGSGYGSGSYGSGSYGSSGGYGSYGSYGSAASYGSGGYGSGSYNYSNYGNQSSNRGGSNTSGGWGQYSSSNNQAQSQNPQWGSGSGSNWSGYNYNNYGGSGSSYGGSGYSY